MNEARNAGPERSEGPDPFCGGLMIETEPPPTTVPDGAALLRTYLADRSEPCPNCQYDLRGLTSDTCPECGLQLVLRVGLAEPKQAAFIAGLIGLACATGFFIVWEVLIVLISVAEHDWPPEEFILGTTGAGAFFGVLCWLWIARRSRLRRMSPKQRTIWVAACWVAPPAAALLFLAVSGW